MDESDKDDSGNDLMDESDKDESDKDESDKLPVLCDHFTNNLYFSDTKKRKTRKRKKHLVIYFNPSNYHGNLSRKDRFPGVSEKFIVKGKRRRVPVNNPSNK